MPQDLTHSDADVPTRWSVVVLCMLFNVIDGLDAMAMAFTGSRVSAEWGLGAGQLGVLLSASLLGMAGGSLLGSRADLHGRRPLLLAALSLSGLSMLLSFCSQDYYQLLLLRVLTGLGIGAVLVGANVLAYESASPRRRNLAIALQSVAFALGAGLGGLLAHQFNEWIGWRYVFLAGGGVTLAGAVAGAFWLRESPQFIRLAATTPRVPRSEVYGQLFAARQWRLTASLALALFLAMASFYFVMSWTPTLMVRNGFSEQQGAVDGLLLSCGGMFGALLVGLSANRSRGRALLLGLLLLNALVMVLMASLVAESALPVAVGVIAGMALNGAIAALFVLAPQSFPAAIRASGVGLVLATGRLGAIISPAVAGSLLVLQWSTGAVFLLFACSQVLAALLVWLGFRRAAGVCV
ncbi:MFS transporter [Pseudomonas sp. BGr12]|uniref:MFS transporter n=1 Tax=unclassified Pseudomonas TaxID=196821 RepID=UPI002559FFB9|nr:MULTISPECIES: MFS transporter [unclassified Pseudomonas]MDL2429962.1 MFS transporter [Pseudomonas sp. BJa5]